MSTPELSALLAVQDLDTALDQLAHRRSHLAERAELDAADAGIERMRAEVDEVDRSRSDLDLRQSAAESELASAEERAAALNRRLYGGEVSASRDLQAMAAELDQLKSRASGLEDAVLGLLEEREPLDSRAAELGRDLEEATAGRESAAQRLRSAEADIDVQAEELRRRRDEAVGPVPAPLRASYERLRSRLGGVGVARLVGNRCDGCHLTLSAVELDRVRHLAEGEVYNCEQCGRILVPEGPT